MTTIVSAAGIAIDRSGIGSYHRGVHVNDWTRAVLDAMPEPVGRVYLLTESGLEGFGAAVQGDHDSYGTDSGGLLYPQLDISQEFPTHAARALEKLGCEVYLRFGACTVDEAHGLAESNAPSCVILFTTEQEARGYVAARLCEDKGSSRSHCGHTDRGLVIIG